MSLTVRLKNIGAKTNATHKRNIYRLKLAPTL